MPFNGSGTFSPASGNPAVAGTTILSSLYNDTVNDVANGLTNAVTRDGQGVMNVQFKIVNGTVSVPGLGFNAETSSGLYLPGLTLGPAIVSQGVEVARFKTNGNVLIGSTTDTGERLQVTGTAKVTGNTSIGGTLDVTGAVTLTSNATIGGTLGVTGVSTFALGSVSTPSITFTGDTDTGFYRSSADTISVANGGAQNYILGSTLFSVNVPIGASVGTAALPTIRFQGDSDSGLWQSAVDNIDFSIGGTNRLSLNGSALKRISGTGSGQTANSNADDLTIDSSANAGISILTPNTASALIYFGDPEATASGRITYAHTTDAMGFVCAGSTVLTLADGSITAVDPILVPDGTATAPSLAFKDDTTLNTGFYRVSENVIGVTTGGSQAATFDATGNFTAVGSVNVGNDIVFGGASSIMYNSGGTGYIRVSAGAGGSAGSNVLMYGDSHATLPSVGRLCVATTPVFEWGSGYAYQTGTLYINSGSVGNYTPNASGDDFVIDHGISGGMSLLTSNAGTSYIMFGDGDAAFIGGLRYQHSTDTLSFYAGGTYGLSLTDSAASLASGVDAVLSLSTGPSSTASMGFRGVPQQSKSANYTLVLSDAGKHVYHPLSDTAGRTFTIPANASVAFPIGTVVSFVNMDTASCTIAITTDTMYLAGAGTTGSRTLAQFGIATAIKTGSTEWLISGTNLT